MIDADFSEQDLPREQEFAERIDDIGGFKLRVKEEDVAEKGLKLAHHRGNFGMRDGGDEVHDVLRVKVVCFVELVNASNSVQIFWLWFYLLLFIHQLILNMKEYYNFNANGFKNRKMEYQLLFSAFSLFTNS
jgi:hypothetical protein